MRIVECEQGSVEWFEARRGIPTASGFSNLITPSRGEPSKSMVPYIYQLLAEKYTGGCPVDIESYTSRAMQDGIDMEPEARRCYAFLAGGEEVREVGFCLSDDGRFGCSPDGLVGDDGGLELKCPLPKTHIKYLVENQLPDEYKAQVHGSLIVTGRKWWDFMSYAHGLPEFRIRVEPDEFTDKLRECMAAFVAKFDATERQIQGLGVELPEVPVDLETEEIIF